MKDKKWKHHKYIKIVTTSSGKKRYIYARPRSTNQRNKHTPSGIERLQNVVTNTANRIIDERTELGNEIQSDFEDRSVENLVTLLNNNRKELSASDWLRLMRMEINPNSEDLARELVIRNKPKAYIETAIMMNEGYVYINELLGSMRNGTISDYLIPMNNKLYNQMHSGGGGSHRF